MREFARRRPALSFSLLLLAWTWGFMALVIALVPIDPAEGPQFVHVALVFLVASPSVFGLAFARLIDGKKGVRSLLVKAGMWRVSPIWYAISLLLIPALVGVATLLRGLFGADLAGLDLLGSLLFAIPVALLAAVMEEFGWRGFLLPKLLEKHTALRAALIVGCVWALWHAPINYLGVSKFGLQAIPLLLILLLLPIAETLLMVWVYKKTSGSLLMMILMHLSITSGHILFALPSSTASAEIVGNLLVVGVLAAAAAIAVVAGGLVHAGHRP